VGVRLQSGATIIQFETLDSTSLEAKRRAAEGARGPLWILALEQTAGYGRRGSEWRQAAGDVAATFLFDPHAETEHLGELSFVAALAVSDAIAERAPGARIALKWPNDVLIDGAKTAGILPELIADRTEPLVALGVGVNIVSKPEGLEYPTTRLIDHLAGAPAPSPKAFVASLDATLDQWIGTWRNNGFQPIRTAWLERAARLGEKIRVRLPNETIEGVFKDLDQTGALVLDCDGGRRFISAGAVFPAPPAGRV
jgi:BirA family biotin operon repressor/biotin-[acetyl-CoA-carboxylase] ligase